MYENIGRKITISVLLVIAALACLFLPKQPFRLGLDLQGGTRLVYRFDFERALQEGKISAHESGSKGEMLQNFASIIRGRVDPNGVMELSLRPEGEDRIVIELPGAAELATSTTKTKIVKDLGENDTTIVLDASNVETIKAFPPDGGVITVDGEKINYSRRVGDTLTIAANGRGFQSTTRKAHAAGADVDLLTNDDLQRRIENVGDMQFMLGAKAQDFSQLGSDLQRERQKVDAWIDAHPDEPIEHFNNLPPDKGGPPALLRWYPHRTASGEAERPVKDRLAPLIIPPPEWRFSGDDLEAVGFSQDHNGYPAVSFEIVTEKKGAFGDFTGSHIDDGMAIVLNGEIATLATINDKLPGQGIINGGAAGFTQKEVKDLITILRSGSLRIRPELLDKSRVGASLGDDYVAKSVWSALTALGVIVLFMVFFYHRLGMFSVIGLIVNLLLLLGALAFLRATLTLPGVAGVILTLGMAVDSNILIYERLREELNRGLKLAQAHKAAYSRAAVTIIDSHVTQLIAGVILYFVGTGPIRGFATTLNIGILSTLFSVLIVTELMVVLDIKRGRKTYSMVRVLEKPNIKFMDSAKYAIGASVIVIVAGLALFAKLPENEKLGIDFLGGFTMTVRTQEPQSIGTVRELVSKIPGSIGKSAEVKEILDSGTKSTGFTKFRITHKLTGAGHEGEGVETSEKELREALASVLLKDPIQYTVETSPEGNATLHGTIAFDRLPATADITKALEGSGLKQVDVKVDPARRDAAQFSGQADKELAQSPDLLARLHRNFDGQRDSSDRPFALTTAVPESAMVGAQVGGELRDKAVLAVLLSLLGTVLYLRVRFAEYSYGVAVVVSLLHDVFIALGALAFATWTGILQAEVDLSMIAAFLTIIGYSQNDTIVIFDRVRENLPRSKKPLKEVLNDSINETLGRTILTTATVVLTLIVLFVFNVGTRNVLEGFSYAMLVGVISGAYSTVYVASPVLLWFEERAQKRAQRAGVTTAQSDKDKEKEKRVPAV